MKSGLVYSLIISAGLMAIASPALNKAKELTCYTNMRAINQQLEIFHVRTGKWADETAYYRGSSVRLEDTALNSKKYYPDGVPSCPFDGGEYAIHSISHRVRCQHTDNVKSAQSKEDTNKLLNFCKDRLKLLGDVQ